MCIKTDITILALLLAMPGTSTTLHGSSEEKFLVSPILSLSAFTEGQSISLNHSFHLKINGYSSGPISGKQQFLNSSRPQCAFHIRNERKPVWSTHGCITYIDDEGDHLTTRNSTENTTSNTSLQTTNFRRVACQCNHTTSFAILMSVIDVKLSPIDVLALDIITYVGCGITVVTTVIAITVFTCIKSLNSEKVCVHRNLCLAILASQIIFLLGIQAVDNKILCGIVALLLHYFYMATFVWMLVEGLHLYNKVVRVFGTEKTRIMYYICFGWGVPFLLVAVSAAIDWDGYGTERSCWLSIGRSTIWAFVGPAMSILFVNYLILFVVLKIVVMAAGVERPDDDFMHVKAGVKASLFLSPLLGLTWVFGLVAVNHDMIIFQYIFSILNSLQGFFIFLYHCILNTDVRQTLKRIQSKRMIQREFGNYHSDSSKRASYSESRTAVTPKEFMSPVFKRINNNHKINPDQNGEIAKARDELRRANCERLTLIHM